MTPRDLSWIRGAGSGPLIVKGIQRVDDARKVVDAGADAVVVSNHGGRQLDRAPTPLELLPEVVDAVGDRAEVLVDGGVRSGADIVAAVALGARACLVGRAYLYGLMAGGERGVERAVEILTSEITRTTAVARRGQREWPRARTRTAASMTTRRRRRRAMLHLVSSRQLESQSSLASDRQGQLVERDRP